MNLDILKHTDIIEICNKIVQLHDHVAVGPGLAALFLGISEKTLARLRQNGSGPPYNQYPALGSKARNQKVNYLMGELRKWRASHQVKSTMDGAVTRGLAFCSINDVMNAQPFWFSHEAILGHAMNSNKEAFILRLKNPEISIVWLSWPIALKQSWGSREAKEQFLAPYKALLTKLLNDANQY